MNENIEEIPDSPLTFRADAKNRQQLKELEALWSGSNRSRVIIRCIEWAWMMEIGGQKFDVKPSDMDRQESRS